MDQLPIFVNLRGVKILVVGDGDGADAKRRLIERAGGICVDDCPAQICSCGRLAFIAMDDENAAIEKARILRAKGILVNIVDRPQHCDFTTPAIVDRSPVLIAVGTGGASAGLAKALRQRMDALLPQNLGQIAQAVFRARDMIKARWPAPAERRRAIDAAFGTAGMLDPFREHSPEAVDIWLANAADITPDQLITITLTSNDPEDLTLRTARILGEADHIFHDVNISPEILNRARADAIRHIGTPPETPPAGMILHLRLQGTD